MTIRAKHEPTERDTRATTEFGLLADVRAFWKLNRMKEKFAPGAFEDLENPRLQESIPFAAATWRVAIGVATAIASLGPRTQPG
jgi:hypothetical protein